MDVLLSGAAGFMLHEDWGTMPLAINVALEFAEEHDVAITIHTDTLNESGFVDNSIVVMKGRTIHTYHTEGTGGGHAPDIIKIVSEDYVLPISTNSTQPFTKNTIDEHLDMLMVCHHLSSSIPGDIAFATPVISVDPGTFAVVADGKLYLPMIQWRPFHCPKSTFFFKERNSWKPLW